MAHLKIAEKDGFTIVSLKGQFIGGEETDQLRSSLNELGENAEPKVLLDMDGVSYLNSTALSVLISAQRNVAKQGGKIALCKIGKTIENVFVQTKLILVFSIYSTIEDAIADLS